MAMLATGIPKLDFGLDFAAFILDDSYVANYIQSTREADFYSGSDLSQRDIGFNVYFPDGTDYATSEFQGKVDAMKDELHRTKHVAGPMEYPVQDWLQDFRKFTKNHPSYKPYTVRTDASNDDDEAASRYFDPLAAGLVADRHAANYVFEAAVSDFLAAFPAYSQVVRRASYDYATGIGYGRVVMSYISLLHVDTPDEMDIVQAMRDVREVTAASRIKPEPFCYAEEVYQLSETHPTLYREMVINAISSFVVVLTFVAAVIRDWRGVAVCGVAIIVFNIELVGALHFIGIKLGVITTVEILVAIGLVIDSIAHIAHSSIQQSGSANERVKKALEEIGPAALLGAGSTLTGVACLSLSQCEMHREVFRVFTTIVLIGLTNGLLLTPVLMSMILPDDQNAGVSTKDLTDDEDDDEGAVPGLLMKQL